MTVIEFAGISDFIGCDQKYENSYSEVLRFIRERMTFRVYTSVRDKFYLILVFVFIIPVGLSAQNTYIQGVVQDIDGTPLAGAVVMLMRDGTRVAATTCKITVLLKSQLTFCKPMFYRCRLSDSVIGKFLFLC